VRYTNHAAAVVDRKARISLIIEILAYPTCIRRPRSHRNIAMPFGIENLEYLGYPMVKKLTTYLFVLTESTNVTDRQTHRRTPLGG